MFPLPIRNTQNIAVIHAASGLTTLVYDTFTDADATSLTAHTIAPTNTPSTSWTERVGTWTISGNKAVSTFTSNSHATCNPGVADCTITCKAQTSATNGNMAYDVGLVVRWGATTDYFLVGINSQGDLFRISERVSDNPVSRATASVTIDAGTEYTIVVTLSGTSISATLDGANQISYASATANQTATIHGIKGRIATDTIDDFQVVA